MGKKAFSIINIVLSIMLFCATIGLFIYYKVAGDPLLRASSCLFVALLVVLPYLYELIAKRKLSNMMKLLYFCYILAAAFVGSAIGVYKTSNIYDKVIHFVFGYIANYVALIIATRVVDKNRNPWFVLLICFMFTMCLSAIWEIMEYATDLFGGTAQGPKINDTAPYVTDSMLDMIMALGGQILFCIQYLIHVFTHKNLLIDYTINDWNSHSGKIMCLHKDDK